MVSENVETALQKLDFQIRYRNVKPNDANGSLEADLVAERKGVRYLIETRFASRPESFLNTTFFRAWTHLQACLRELETSDHPLRPLLVVEFEEPLGKRVERFLSLFDRYAPNCSWIAVEHVRPLRYRIYEENGTTEQIRPEDEMEVTLNVHKNRDDQKLRFSDLELWMYKCLLYSQHPPKKGWNKNPDPIPNGNQLSERADVSLPTVYDWLNAMEHNLYLKRELRESLHLVNIPDYLDDWTGRYRFQENEGHVQLQFIRSTDHPMDSLLERLAKKSGDKDRSVEYALTGHAGASVYKMAYSTAKSIHLFRFHDRMDSLKDELGLVPAEDHEPDVISCRPRFNEAVKRGIQHMDDVPVVDPLQLYLDCFHLPDRGREQSEYLLRKLFPDLEVH